MRVLLVSYYFPPAGGGGVQRVLGWCRHLPANDVEVTVVAPQEPHWIDQDTTLVIPGSTSVLRTVDPSPAAVIPRDALAQVGGVRRLARRLALQPRRFAVPDIHRRWRRPAVRAVLAEAARMRAAGEPGWDVVVSSSPPETTHLIAHDVARALDIPWIADYRDSWLDLPHLRMSSIAVRWKHARNRRLATRLMRDAAAAVTVSEPLAQDLRGRHPGLDVTVVENGFERPEVDRAASRAEGFRDPDRFVVAYTGNFFGRQSAASFLAAVEQALEREPALGDDLLLRFVGGLKPAERARLDALVERGVAEHEPFLRHDDVLAHQRAADLLFLYVAPGVGSRGVFTGKVFEYVAARRPVLALAPVDNVASELLALAGATSARGGARVDPDEVPAITDALIDAWGAWGSADGTLPDVDVPDELLASLDRADGARRLAALLRAVTGRA
jgi:glycosyltransferase involved in cell wall biosynthesis